MFLPERNTGGMVKKSTRDSMLKRKKNLSSAAMNRMQKYTMKKMQNAKSIWNQTDKKEEAFECFTALIVGRGAAVFI